MYNIIFHKIHSRSIYGLLLHAMIVLHIITRDEGGNTPQLGTVSLERVADV